MGCHTKRSPEFKKEIDQLSEVLKNLLTLSVLPKSEVPQFLRIIEILQYYTTDSGCVVKAAEDEPIFVLRGKDINAPIAVAMWEQFTFREHHNRIGVENFPDHLKAKLVDAQDCVLEMDKYPNRKLAD